MTGGKQTVGQLTHVLIRVYKVGMLDIVFDSQTIGRLETDDFDLCL
jgi:hypothetical protein